MLKRLDQWWDKICAEIESWIIILLVFGLVVAAAGIDLVRTWAIVLAALKYLLS